MKAVEFEGTKTLTGEIALPPEIAGVIPAGELLRVVIMWDPSSSDSDWRAAGRQRLEAAYSPEDSVYEELLGEDSSAG